MARLTGFEPASFSLRTRSSDQLSYRRTGTHDGIRIRTLPIESRWLWPIKLRVHDKEIVERAAEIESASLAWKARAQPLYQARIHNILFWSG